MNDCSWEGNNDLPKPNLDDDDDNDDDDNDDSKNFPLNTISPYKFQKWPSYPTSHFFDCLLILDARFEYEFKGGRIIGAINITSYKSMISLYKRYIEDVRNGKSIAIIIHCELSSQRGPKLYNRFREYDRDMNQYPNLTYPNLFLLEGGYKKFYGLYPEFCIGGYVSMYDPKYVSSEIIKKCQKQPRFVPQKPGLYNSHLNK